MESILITVITVIAVLLAVYFTVKHLKGGRGCCSGGGFRVKRKKLPKIIYKKTFKVTGMHCKHCAARIEEAVNDIDGVVARVNLKRNELIVLFAKSVSDETVIAKIKRLGYGIEAE